MQRLVFVLIALVLAGAIAVTAMDSGKAPPPEHGGRTGDRISQAQMAKMVAGPVKLIEKKDFAGAARLFEADLKTAQAKGGVRVGDLLDAYGTQLQVADRDKEALPYYVRAIAAYRVADPGGPILANELAGYGVVLYQLDPKSPPPVALASLREALAIRERVLGRRNAETAMNYAHLGMVQGSPTFTGRDPARVAAAASLIRTGIQLLPNAPNAQDYELSNARVLLVELYAANGDAAGAFKAANQLAAASRFDPSRLTQAAELFEAAGDAVTGRKLRDQFGIPEPEKDEDEEPATPPTIKNAGKLNPGTY